MSGDFPDALQPWLSEIVLAAGCLLLAVLSRGKNLAGRASDVALLILAASAVGAVASMDALQGAAAGGILSVDPFAAFFKFVLSMSALAVAWLSTRAREVARSGEASPLSWAAFFVSLLGMDVMVSSAHLLGAWAGFEIAAIGSALWVVLRRPGDARAASSALVLLLEGTAASALMLFGVAMLYALAGTLAYEDLGGRLAVALSAPGGRTALFASLVLVLAGATWRLALAPWERSRVELSPGGPLSEVAWLAVGPAIASVAMLARFLRCGLSSPIVGGDWTALPGVDWPFLLSILSMVAMTIGNVAAVRETNLRRLVAWLTVSQAGYLAIGLTVLTDAALEAMLFHVVAYALMVFGLLAALAPAMEQAGSDDFEVLRGLARRRGSAKPVAAAIAVFLLSLSAVPPLAGYAGRSLLLTALFKSGSTMLASVATVASAVGLVVLVRIVATLLDRPQDADDNLTLDFEAVTLVLLLLVGTVGLGVWPDPLLRFVDRSVVFFGG